MAIKGSLKEASLPDVLQLLALGQKTGCLSIADRSNFGYIYFDRGRISYASIVNRRDRLGDILVKHDKITQEQLDAAIHRQAKERDKKLGEILVIQNVLTQQELERYMRMQIEESVYYLFTWTQGTFNFEADVKKTDAPVEELRNLAIAVYEAGMLDEAAREFRRVAELRGSDANAHFFIGLVGLKQARWREAMEALRLAAEKGGSRPAVLHNLGLAYEQLGRLEDAEAAYSEAAARARTDPRVYVGWGIVALKQGDYASAAGRLDRAKELFAEKVPPIWFWARVLAAAAAGDFETAEQVAAQAVEAFPHNGVLRNNLSVLHELAGNLPEAEELAHAALQDEPSLPQLSKNLGDLAYRGSRYDEAWALYQRAIALAPELGDDVYFKLGNIAYKRNNREQADALWRRALELNPKHELVKANLDTLSALS